MPLLNEVMSSTLYERKSQRNTSASPEVSAGGAMTWGAMRLHHTLDSALSGGITGSVLNTWKRSYLLLFLRSRVKSDSNGPSLRRNAWYIYRADIWVCLLHPRTIALQRVRRPTHKIHRSEATYPFPVADTHSFGAFKTPCA
jgi:hypothetical protein